MTASAVGPAWRQATPEQQKRLQDEFKTLLVRTYSGALAQVERPDHQRQAAARRPGRHRGGGAHRNPRPRRPDPARLPAGKDAGPGAGWKIYNLNVLGVWLVETYRSQFAQEINAKGIDGLIATLAERNKSNAGKKG